MADLLTEHPGVREEQRGLPPVDEHAVGLHGVGRGADAVPRRRERSTRPRTSPFGHQLRWKNSRIDSAIASTMPASTPKKHDTAERGEGQHERDSCARGAKRLTTATSASESAAEITTAASADCGRSASSELKNRSRSATQAAPTSPVSWLFAPGLLGDGGARAARRHGEALEQPGGDVRRARCRSSPGSGRPRRRAGRRSWSTWRSCRSARRA